MDDTQSTAAACRYILVGLLQRLERTQPGLLAELRSGTDGDRQVMSDYNKLSPEVDLMFSEVQRILRLSASLVGR